MKSHSRCIPPLLAAALGLATIVGTPEAFAATYHFEYCFELATEYDDETGLEDWSTLDSPFRRARGAKVTVNDNCSSDHVYYLDEDTGCADIAIHGWGPFAITIHAEAQVNGAELKSYSYDFSTPSDYYIPSVTYGQHTGGSSERTITVDLTKSSNGNVERRNQAWHNLAVGMWAMHRSDYHLGDFGNKAGCAGQSFPGTSSTPCCEYQSWNDTPHGGSHNWNHDYVPPKTLIFFVPNGIDQEKNFASSWLNCLLPEVDNTSVTDGRIPAVAAHQRMKFQIAHELGHVVVMQRMGDREEESYTAPLHGCMGSYRTDGSPADTDDDGEQTKSLLTREYSSGAAREGWAHFFSAWLFNRSSESDCWFQPSYTVQDFDLDGTFDNVGQPVFAWDGVFTCEGAGLASPLFGSPASWVSAKDWLEDAYNEGVCGSELPTCLPGEDSRYDNCSVDHWGRSTQYDWMRYFWDMASDEGIPMNKLTDIFVDMCPTEWRSKTYEVEADGDWPERRLRRSAEFHGELGAHDRQRSNGVDHYQ